MSAFSTIPIVVPVDLSDQPPSAVDVALDMAQRPDQVHVIHVIHEPPSGYPEAIWANLDRPQHRQYALEALAERLSSPEYESVNKAVEFGDPGRQIVAFAEQLGAGLIVMPSHGRTGVSRMFLGSVAERVVRLAHCPVLVLREAPQESS